MWGGWVDRLASRLEAASGLALREGLYALLGVELATGRVHAHGLLAATPMSRIREAVAAFVAEAGAGPERAEAAVDAGVGRPRSGRARPAGDGPREPARAAPPRVRLFAVATSDDRDPTVRTLESLGIAGEFADLACADDGIPNKPAPDPVLRLCARLGVPPDRTAVVGDSPADLRMGRAAGVARTIARPHRRRRPRRRSSRSRTWSCARSRSSHPADRPPRARASCARRARGFRAEMTAGGERPVLHSYRARTSGHVRCMPRGCMPAPPQARARATGVCQARWPSLRGPDRPPS